ncbi:pentatricopeptide repeat-containing protein At4g02750-like [Selaginella moellendorffii]|uniref:pentatricopeptide repeat-containing protein At4g02750-like n=1 Tax=Selaginella moellendorffii TaxID=88036 RepID=UPI000D1D1161|nr:pentatricopeptide repeat-containing protein At4g02750-like [Selaginella moellendorffii]|eukprot:XP_024534782.1 pentatricopeptide repeat-containing protein At4g02750-like [Selaginella moellendorffii]
MPGGRCVVSWTTILSSCSQSRHLDDARAIFARMPQHDPISWNAMISALGHNGRIREAEELFAALGVKSVSSCNAMIVAYAESGNLEDARRIFNGMMDRSPATWGSMVLAYAQSGHVREAQRLFHSMPVKDMVAWNSLMTAFSRSEDEDERREALRVFGAMESPSSGLVPNEHSYMAVLESCGKLGALAEGREIHARIAKRGFDACDLVAASLIEMYGRCGSVDEAVAVLDQTRSLGRSVWSAAICALGQNGIGGAALWLLQRMQLQGIEVDASSTFVSLLAACSHGGMLREGVELFRSMVGDFGVEPVLEHFLCLVDLLGRAGQLDRALELVTSMPYQADAVAWVSLLSACSVHADKARGALATSSLLEIDRSDAASYFVDEKSAGKVEAMGKGGVFEKVNETGANMDKCERHGKSEFVVATAIGDVEAINNGSRRLRSFYWGSCQRHISVTGATVDHVAVDSGAQTGREAKCHSSVSARIQEKLVETGS